MRHRELLLLGALLCAGERAGAADSPLQYPPPPDPFGPPSGAAGDTADKPQLLRDDDGRPVHSRTKRRPSMRPLICAGALAAACTMGCPSEPSLVAALDAHHARFGALIEPALREGPLSVRGCGVASVATHSELLWLGVLGQWLPLLPISPAALQRWASAASAAQLVIGAAALGYVLRRLLPRRTAERHLAVSYENAVRRGRVWTLLTASVSPAGLVHLLHAAALLLLAAPPLEAHLGRARLIGAFALAGLTASVGAAVAQLPFRSRAAARSSISGAVMGVLALRAALLPAEPVRLGHARLPIGR